MACTFQMTLTNNIIQQGKCFCQKCNIIIIFVITYSNVYVICYILCLHRVFSERKYTDNKGDTKNVSLVVISLSPQPVLSLAARYKLTPEEATSKLAGNNNNYSYVSQYFFILECIYFMKIFQRSHYLINNWIQPRISKPFLSFHQN